MTRTQDEGIRDGEKRKVACRRSCMATVINRRMIASAPLVKYSQDMIGLITGDYRTLITDTPLLPPHTTLLFLFRARTHSRQCHLPSLPPFPSSPPAAWRVVESRSFMPRFSLQCEVCRGGMEGTWVLEALWSAGDV